MVKHISKIMQFGLFVGLLILNTAVWTFAEGPAVPAGTAQPTASATAAAPSSPGIGGMLLPFVLMFAIVYFLMIRPQQRKMKEQQNMLSSLKQGDEIITSSGILGKVTGLTEKVVTLEIADNCRVKILKSQVAQIIKGPLKDLT